MALSGVININDTPLGWWEAVNRGEVFEGFTLTRYDCTYHSYSDGQQFRFEIRYRPSTGALGLASLVLSKVSSLQWEQDEGRKVMAVLKDETPVAAPTPRTPDEQREFARAWDARVEAAWERDQVPKAERGYKNRPGQ